MFNPKYIHLRQRDSWGRGYPLPTGGATVAYLPLNNERTFYKASLARCRSDERFVKAIGREEAASRLDTHFFVIPVDIDLPSSVSEQVIQELVRVGAFNFWKGCNVRY